MKKSIIIAIAAIALALGAAGFASHSSAAKPPVHQINSHDCGGCG